MTLNLQVLDYQIEFMVVSNRMLNARPIEQL